MFCPECRTEYRDGFARCADCEVDLVPQAPPKLDPIEYVEVYSTPDLIELSMLKSLLDGEGVAYYVSGDLDHRIVGYTGGTLFVDRDRADEIRHLISDFRSKVSTRPGEEEE